MDSPEQVLGALEKDKPVAKELDSVARSPWVLAHSTVRLRGAMNPS